MRIIQKNKTLPCLNRIDYVTITGEKVTRCVNEVKYAMQDGKLISFVKCKTLDAGYIDINLNNVISFEVTEMEEVEDEEYNNGETK